MARQKWADENIKDCQEDCDRKGRIEVCLEGDEKPVRVACPLFRRECRRGKVYLSEMRTIAERSVPSSIPPRYRRNLAKCDKTEAILGVGEWQGTGVLYIYGLTGTGKSFAAAWWVYNRMLQKLDQEWDKPYLWREIVAHEVRWFTAFEVCLDRTTMYEARNAPLLIVDDLGCESDTPSNRAIMNDLIANRYSYGVPTIITSNLTLEEMNSRYKDRMYERIVQTGKAVDAGRYNKRIE